MVSAKVCSCTFPTAPMPLLHPTRGYIPKTRVSRASPSKQRRDMARTYAQHVFRKASVAGRSGVQLEPDAQSMNWSVLEEAVRASLLSAAN